MGGHLLSSYRQRYNNLDRSVYFASYPVFCKTGQGSGPAAYLAKKYGEYYAVLLNGGLQLVAKEWAVTSLQKIVGKQHGPLTKSIAWATEKDKQGQANARVAEQFPNAERSQAMLDGLDAIIEISLRHHIEVVGVGFPLSGSYLQAMKGIDLKVYSILTSRHIRVLDFKNIFAGDDSFFKDQDHLNEEGANAFVGAIMQAEGKKQ